MATFHRFEEIEVWQKARVFTRKIYNVTGQGAFFRDFGLKDQIREASVSIMSNIAEGYERSGTREFKHFLSVAKGSAGEARSELYVAFDQGYLTERVFENLVADASEIGRMISGLISYLGGSGLRGTKFKSKATAASTQNRSNPKTET